MSSTPSVEQAIKNNVKVARSMIRLRHSIEADTVISNLIPKLRVRLESQAASGQVTGLGYEELIQLLDGREE